MKKSFYNHVLFVKGSWVLYNAFTDLVCILAPETKELYSRSPKDIEKAHPDYYNYLVKNSFLVEDEIDEYKRCVNGWKERDRSPKHFEITINPTLDCNMRCWYCYEKHHESKVMSPEIVGRVKTLIKTKLKDPLLESLTLSFFGGEPLMQFDAIVEPLLDYARDLATKNDKNLDFSFTTNGYLLNERVLSKLRLQ